MELAKLRQILEIAAIAPGNRERFLASGLLQPFQEGTVQLSTTWYDDFQRLPPLSKETVRSNPGAFLVDTQDLVYRGSTSGSRGEHFIYFAGTEWNQARLRARQRGLDWWGIDANIPILNVGSRLFPGRWQDAAIVGQFDQSFYDQLWHELAQGPTVIRGYPSRLCDVATQLRGQSLPPIVAVIATGECLFEFQVTLLEETFAAPVINEYGCQEVGISGLTCPEARRLHLDDDRCFYEVIAGQLVATDLYNFVMPLVRYQCGDVLTLDTSPCPCGRPGLTAHLSGRIEDWIRTQQGQQHPGEIAMPPIPGVLQYQAIRESTTHLTLHIQPELDDRPLDLTPLATWVQNTFGDVAVQLLVETPDPDTEQPMADCDPNLWIKTLTHGNWNDWQHQPTLPEGELRSVAQLLLELVAPRVITYGRFSKTAQDWLDQILKQPPSHQPEWEWMILRVLCFACCQIKSDTQAQQVAQQVFARLQQVMQKSPYLPATGLLDYLILVLFRLPDDTTTLWSNPLFEPLQAQLPQPDNFTIQQLLRALEVAVGQVKSSPLQPKLRPLLTVVIADLESFVDRLSLPLLAHWFELLQGQPMPNAQNLPEPADSFLQTWLRWRRAFLYQTEERYAYLRQLATMAQSPQEHLRVTLEQGYDQISQGGTIETASWQPILENVLSHQLLTPVAWTPLLRSLAQSLLQQGKQSLAYECLIAATVPSSMSSAFELRNLPSNHKQSVLSDRACPACH